MCYCCFDDILILSRWTEDKKKTLPQQSLLLNHVNHMWFSSTPNVANLRNSVFMKGPTSRQTLICRTAITEAAAADQTEGNLLGVNIVQKWQSNYPASDWVARTWSQLMDTSPYREKTETNVNIVTKLTQCWFLHPRIFNINCLSLESCRSVFLCTNTTTINIYLSDSCMKYDRSPIIL